MNKKLTPVEGYDWNNYNKNKGIDPTGVDVPSNLVVEQVKDLILGGYEDLCIRDMLYLTYGMNSYSTRFIIATAHKRINENVEKQSENMLKKQTSRLFRLYRECIDKGDSKTALQTLAEINKLHKLYVQKIEVTSDIFTLDLGLNDSKLEEN